MSKPLICLGFIAISTSVYANSNSHITRHVSLSRNTNSSGRPIPEAQFTFPIVAKVPRRESKKVAFNRLKGSGSDDKSSNQPVSLSGANYVGEYLINATIGPNVYSMVLDTGSSDTWLPQKGFSCLDLDSNPQPESFCLFASTFDTSKSKTFKAIPNVNFNISYGMLKFRNIYASHLIDDCALEVMASSLSALPLTKPFQSEV